MIEFTSVEIVPNPANAGQNLLISIGVEETGLSYQDVINAISYSGTMSASQVTYATSKTYAVFKFLSSGTLSLSRELKGDIFCVGGGAGGQSGYSTASYYRGGMGAGSGYTATLLDQLLVSAIITIGAGGPGGARASSSTGSPGGASSYGALLSAQGAPACGSVGTSNGGSAGGRGVYDNGDVTYNAEPGATNGGSTQVGTGQGTTTRAFEEPDGELLASGGDGCTRYGTSVPGAPNTGDGGDGGNAASAGAPGGSGIVMIRVEIAA
jgi:hypothetical protein